MNARIRELAEQAGIQLPNNLVEGVNGPGVISPKDKLAKFAKSIVQECANKVDWILAEGGKTQGDLIREHFGVAE